MPNNSRSPQQIGARASIKCLVWDLDDTLWQGTLLEGDDVVVTPAVRETISELDNRGILQSIASKNDHDAAWDRLVSFGLDYYFLHPQINWSDKSESIRTIAERLDIGVDTLALIDDQPFERDEVSYQLPEVLTLDPAGIGSLLELPELTPRFVTSDSRLRRQMYKADLERKQDEEQFAGDRKAFLGTLGMVLTVRAATTHDLQRAEELTVRTNQLNTSGRIYSYEELNQLLHSKRHSLLVAELEDRYGSSGTVGLVLIELHDSLWLLRLFIMSCRVISRGIGGIMLSCVLMAAKRRGMRLLAEFVPSDCNRMMYATYKFSGFYEREAGEASTLLEHDLEQIKPIPDYVELNSIGLQIQ